MGSDVEVLTEEERIRQENSEVQRLWCDNTKIHNISGYLPKIGIREGLEKTIDWFSNPENLKTYKTQIYNV